MASCPFPRGLEEVRDAAHLGWGLSKGDGADAGAEGPPLALEAEKCRPLCCRPLFGGEPVQAQRSEEDTGTEHKQWWVCACVTVLQF